MLPSNSTLIAQPARVRSRPQTKRAINAILTRRDRLMQDITQLHAASANSSFVANAQQLLTRWWSGASWDTREGLLRNVEWLVRVERHRNQHEPRLK